ncbi:MAG: LysR family transcriptional regulator [Anaerovoracaceae bacterium]
METGTLSQAAEELGYSQSVLTRALNALEEQFGFRILRRDRNGVQLTAEGQLVLPHIRTVLYDQYRLEECVNEINGLRAGLIRIGTFNSVSAPPLPFWSAPGSGWLKTGTVNKFAREKGTINKFARKKGRQMSRFDPVGVPYYVIGLSRFV